MNEQKSGYAETNRVLLINMAIAAFVALVIAISAHQSPTD